MVALLLIYIEYMEREAGAHRADG